ncbi:MAG: metalloregulator ArsR/SmtB family transcription factor [Actinomycetota bacterium]|nr:metalloregulator ArsR/SmtB family transcription factor [Actinomycetota bacterium]
MVSAVARKSAERVSADLGVLAEPHRLLVLRHLRRGARSAGFLAQAIGMSPSLASHHLAVLVSAGLVTRRQKGQFVCYAADRDRVRDLYRRLGQLAGAVGPAAADPAALAADDPC